MDTLLVALDCLFVVFVEVWCLFYFLFECCFLKRMCQMCCGDAANLVLIIVPDICQTSQWYQLSTNILVKGEISHYIKFTCTAWLNLTD